MAAANINRLRDRQPKTTPIYTMDRQQMVNSRVFIRAAGSH